ncbi:MAG: E3 binding domain-containing protein, partial [Candidatus Dormibacteraeota bacterium]|nr:E3 binding domain-containing protein [Candidatus Dormibacteraeota bacterium]
MPDSVPMTLPAMGESVAEGTISRWLKAVGDSVAEGESLVEVTTDKVDVEVPSPATGTLQSIVAEEGATVTVGATLATIAAGAVASAANGGTDRAAGNGAGGSAPADTGSRPTLDVAGPDPDRSTAITPAPTLAANGAATAASPLARRAAALRGVDLLAVHGSGPAGMVRTADVRAATSAPTSPATPA